MAANLIGRYIWEISELRRSRHGLTLNELNERWERSSLYDGRRLSGRLGTLIASRLHRCSALS